MTEYDIDDPLDRVEPAPEPAPPLPPQVPPPPPETPPSALTPATNPEANPDVDPGLVELEELRRRERGRRDTGDIASLLQPQFYRERGTSPLLQDPGGIRVDGASAGHARRRA